MVWLALASALAAAPAPPAKRVTLVVGSEGVEVVGIAPTTAVPVGHPDGELEVLDAQGLALATARVPDPRLRTVITPEGGEAAHLAAGRIDLVVPWPPGATSLRWNGATLALPREPVTALPGAPAVAIQSSGPSESRLDLVFVSDGYTASQLDDFATDVDWIVAYLQGIEPYADYTSLLNIWRVDLPSAQSGGDHPAQGAFVNTALGCAYDCAGIDRLICCDDDAVMDAVLGAVPGAEGVLVLVNDPVYGGSGGFNFAVSYVGEDSGRQVAAHELGHSLVGLWDEYGYGLGSAGQGAGPNCDTDDVPDWPEWVGTDGVGSFQECSYNEHHRPTENACMMRTLADNYCPVCRQEVVLQMFARLPGLVEATSPEAGPVVEAGPIEVDTVLPANQLAFRWTLDGEEVGDGPVYEAPCGTTGQLLVAVEHATPYVRRTSDLLVDAAGPWELAVAACPAPEPELDLTEVCACGHASWGGTWLAWLVLPALAVRRRR